MAERTERQREVERAYEAPADLGLPDLTGGPVAAAGSPVRHDLVAVYHDTADLRLARSRITLRRRTGGTDDGWHIKLPAGSGARTELHRAVGRSARVPASVRRLLRGAAGGADLVPVVELRTARTEIALTDAAGRVLASVADDRVTAQVLTDEAPPTTWREVEVELVEGDAALLGRLGKRLLAGGFRVAAQQSKLRRALGERFAEPAEASHPLVEFVGTQRRALVVRDVLVRDGAADGVHRLRIAARRLRSALRTYRRLLADPSAAAHLADELRWLGRELSAERDLQVTAERLDEPLARRQLRAEQRTARRRTAAALGSDRYLALVDGLDALGSAPLLATGAGRKPRRALTRGVRRAYRRVGRRVAAVPDSGPPGSAGREEALHAVRKAAKRFRYACEVAEPAVGKRARRLRRRTRDLATALGEHQDSVLLRDRLRRLAEAEAATGPVGFGYGRLHAQQETAGTAAVARADRAWRRLTSKKATGWLS